MTARRAPTLRYEREAWRSGAGLLAAVDEVGRGALAGPVSVGVVLSARGVSAWSRLGCGLPGALTLLLMSLLRLFVSVANL